MTIDDDLDRVELLVKVAEQLLEEHLARRAAEPRGIDELDLNDGPTADEGRGSSRR